MALTSVEIKGLTFGSSRRGYDTGEVDEFLDRLVVEIDAMNQTIDSLKGKYIATEAQLKLVQAQAASLRRTPAVGAESSDWPNSIRAQMSEDEIMNYIVQQAREGKSAEEAIRGLFEVFGAEGRMPYFMK